MPTPKTIPSEQLAEFAKAAAKEITSHEHTSLGRGPIFGFVPGPQFVPEKHLDLAKQITQLVGEKMKGGGFSVMKPEPIVLRHPKRIIVGFLSPELASQLKDDEQSPV